MIDPIKVCCFHRDSEHVGVVCPDGKVMCCICFSRFSVKDLFTYPGDVVPSDVCKECGKSDLIPA